MGVFWLISVVVLSLLIRNGEAQVNSFLIDCGANSTTNVSGRKWIGDLTTQNLTVNPPGVAASAMSVSSNSRYSNLYKTARIFTSSANYTFGIIPGNYFIRLHFYPFQYENYSLNTSTFSITANGLRLLSQFSPSDEIFNKNSYLQSVNNSALPIFSLIKEYYVNTESSELSLQFVAVDGSFSFVNAIEIVAITNPLFSQTVTKVSSGESNVSFDVTNGGLETMYRLNVGGPEIFSENDLELYRNWELDTNYMFAQNSGPVMTNSSSISYQSLNDSLLAPLEVYESARGMQDNASLEKRANMSWKFSIDPDFQYLVRLHFCELKYNTSNQRIFKIYINNETASDNFDIAARAGGQNKAYHQDYSDTIPSHIDTLWVQLGTDPASGAFDLDAILNGLEIFKISKSGNLAKSSRKLNSGNGELSGGQSKKWILWVAIGSGITAFAIFSALFTVRFCRRKSPMKLKNQIPGFRPLILYGNGNTSTDPKNSKAPLNSNGSLYRIGRKFTISEIVSATNNFDESLVIGIGGFGKVYKGELDDSTPVAIKRANPQSEQGLREFETEIEMLSKLRHRHLVSLIGFCEERNEMILVYEYMANGTLRSHLFGSDLPPLTWKQRLECCIGAARGLHYLHTGAERGIIHRDVKTTNILLDENFVAKMSDFGLSKDGPALEHTHVSTAVKGSFGYLDPEYFRRQQLTEKSDVYSFGVVLFEVLCARPVINPCLPKEEINLAEWVVKCQRRGMVDQVVDARLAGNCSPDSVKKFGEIAQKCLADEGKNRPTMGDVLWNLEYVLQLHDAALRAPESVTATSLSLTGVGEVEEEEKEEVAWIPESQREAHGREGDDVGHIPTEREIHGDEADSVGEVLVGESEGHGREMGDVGQIPGIGGQQENWSEDAAGAVAFSQLIRPQGR
ncbi:hypothetical protein AMTRI_Chr02g253960 [Amborella trichopoda]